MLHRSLFRYLPRNMTVRDASCATALRHCTPIVYSKLDNGVRVATEYTPNLPFATVGLWIDAGSRFETLTNNGTAHFLEHMNFKGTERYSKRDLETLFEFHGAHFNAYTSRDRTAYYVKAFNKHVEQMLDVVSDLLQNGRYNPRELEAERHTILAEMRDVEQHVEEVIMDNLHQVAYDSSTSGLPLTILGPEENIAKHINKEMIEDYVTTHYTGPRMCFVCCGGIKPEEAHTLADKFFGKLSHVNNRPALHTTHVGGTHFMCNEMMATSNTALAFPICGTAHPDSIALQLVHNLIGQIREANLPQFLAQHRNRNIPEHCLRHLIQLRPFYTPYEDTALLGYTMVTEKDNSHLLSQSDISINTNNNNNNNNNSNSPTESLETASLLLSQKSARDMTQTHLLNYVLSNFYDLCDKCVSEEELEIAKGEFKSSLTMIRDSTTNNAEDIGRYMIYFGHRIPMEEMFESIDSVTPQSLRSTCVKYFSSVKPAIACIGSMSTFPNCEPTQLTQLRLHPQLHPDDFKTME